jgi:glycosyltransferase involved in cell wall biosynthesis
MKILIILKTWPGGVGAVVQNVITEFEKRGHIVKTISRQEDLKIKSFVKSIIPLRRKVKELMEKENYDIIYTQDWSLALPFLFMKKHFCMFHGIQPGWIRILQDFVGKIMNKRLAVVGPNLKKRFPKASLIYNAVDFDMFKSQHKKRDCLGWIAKDEKITEKEVIKMAKERGLKPLIAKNYSIPYKEMPNFYNKCKVFVSMAPDYAGFNLCWLEALACGVPEVIGNDNGIGIELLKKEFKNFTWRNHVDKLLKLWTNGK